MNVDRLKHVAVRRPFTLFGAATLALFYGSAALPASLQPVVTSVLRVLIIPMWAGWDIGMMLTSPLQSGGASTGVLAVVLSSMTWMAGLAPYVAADVIVHAVRRSRVAGA